LDIERIKIEANEAARQARAAQQARNRALETTLRSQHVAILQRLITQSRELNTRTDSLSVEFDRSVGVAVSLDRLCEDRLSTPRMALEALGAILRRTFGRKS
jgi:hypothetical protein